MKLYETTVVVLLLAILALKVYSTFYKTRESYSDGMVFGDPGQLTIIYDGQTVWSSDPK